MKSRLLRLLLLFLLLSGCSSSAEIPRGDGVSIARRGESLAGIQVVEVEESPTATIAPTVIQEATATMPAATATAAVTATETPSVTETLTPVETTSASPTPSLPSAEVVCRPVTDRQFGLEVVSLVNAARASSGLPALVEQSQLNELARQHSEAMACEGFFDHQTPGGDDAEDRALESGYAFNAIGETIAAGYATPDEVVDAWLASSSHRAVLLEAAFSEAGVGYVYAEDSEYLYYWTMVLGSPE